MLNGQEITADQAAVIATTAPVFLILLVADRRNLLPTSGRFVVPDLLVAAFIAGLSWATVNCAVYMEDGIEHRLVPLLWAAYIGAPTFYAFFFVGQIVLEAMERWRNPEG